MSHWNIAMVSLLLVASVASGQEETESNLVLVEGHVFNKHTGVPLENATVWSNPPFRFVLVRTDENGFYSLWVIPGVDTALTAACEFQTKKGENVSRSASIGLPEVPLEPLRRDLYVDARRKRGFSHCD